MLYRASALLTRDDANNVKITNAKEVFSQNLAEFQFIDPQFSLVSFDKMIKSSEEFDEASNITLGLEQATAFHYAYEYPISLELEGAAQAMVEGTESGVV